MVEAEVQFDIYLASLCATEALFNILDSKSTDKLDSDPLANISGSLLIQRKNIRNLLSLFSSVSELYAHIIRLEICAKRAIYM